MEHIYGRQAVFPVGRTAGERGWISMRKVTLTIAFVLIAAVALSATGCGGGTPEVVEIEGNTFLCTDEAADSRTIEFSSDGTFVYSIVTSARTWKITGSYAVENGQLELKFDNSGEIKELMGEVYRYKLNKGGFVDHEDYTWMKM